MADIKIQQALDQIKILQEQVRASNERARLAEERAKIAEEKLKNLETCIQRFQTEITQLHQSQGPTSASHSTSVMQPIVDRQIITEDNISQLENPDPQAKYIKLDRVGDLNRKATALKDVEHRSISLNKAISEGIHRVEVRFEKCNSGGLIQGAVGIMKADNKIPYPCYPGWKMQKQIMLYYYGGDGDVYYKETRSSNNTKFYDGQVIAMELNADVGTLHFFVDGIQQPIFVSGIFQAVKFWFYIQNKESSFSVVSVKKLAIPTAKTLSKEKALQW
ncbi:MAG: hypothetical protein EZS28_014799 [Streblomastix strix]|uniref:B30.2/SPRY domain-containing protein n=1 Tax=Streblomastix strix TaxID=222440 RepID=A0A5J4W3W8_9EUKA|nr:MAG: hypothetical protein EZS28_014799 [Streblomastix strix]